MLIGSAQCIKNTKNLINSHTEIASRHFDQIAQPKDLASCVRVVLFVETRSTFVADQVVADVLRSKVGERDRVLDKDSVVGCFGHQGSLLAQGQLVHFDGAPRFDLARVHLRSGTRAVRRRDKIVRSSISLSI